MEEGNGVPFLVEENACLSEQAPTHLANSCFLTRISLICWRALTNANNTVVNAVAVSVVVHALVALLSRGSMHGTSCTIPFVATDGVLRSSGNDCDSDQRITLGLFGLAYGLLGFYFYDLLDSIFPGRSLVRVLLKVVVERASWTRILMNVSSLLQVGDTFFPFSVSSQSSIEAVWLTLVAEFMNFWVLSTEHRVPFCLLMMLGRAVVGHILDPVSSCLNESICTALESVSMVVFFGLAINIMHRLVKASFASARLFTSPFLRARASIENRGNVNPEDVVIPRHNSILLPSVKRDINESSSFHVSDSVCSLEEPKEGVAAAEFQVVHTLPAFDTNQSHYTSSPTIGAPEVVEQPKEDLSTAELQIVHAPPATKINQSRVTSYPSTYAPQVVHIKESHTEIVGDTPQSEAELQSSGIVAHVASGTNSMDSNHVTMTTQETAPPTEHQSETHGDVTGRVSLSEPNGVPLVAPADEATAHPSETQSLSKGVNMSLTIGGNDASGSEKKRKIVECSEIVGPYSTAMTPEEGSISSTGAVYGETPKKRHRKSLCIQEVVLGDSSTKNADLYCKIGDRLCRHGNFSQAMVEHRKALAIREKAFGKDSLITASSYEKVGMVLYVQGKNNESLREHHKALAIRESLLGKDNLSAGESYLNIGRVHLQLGNHEEALVEYRKALSIRESLVDEEDPKTATCYSEIGVVLSKLGNNDAALTEHRKALSIRETVLGKNHTATAESYGRIGGVLLKQGNCNEALVELRLSLSIVESSPGKKNGETAAVHVNIGSALRKLGKCDAALVEYRKALAIYEMFLKADPKTAETHRSIASILVAQGSYEEALIGYRAALSIYEAVLGKEHLDTAQCYVEVGVALLKLANPSDALPEMRKALAICETVLGTEHCRTAKCHCGVGNALYKMGLFKEASVELHKALSFYEAAFGKNDPRTIQTSHYIDVALRKQRQKDALSLNKDAAS